MKAKITILALVLCLPLFLAAQDNQDSSEVNITDSITPQKGYKSFFGNKTTKYSVATAVLVDYAKYDDSQVLLGDCFTANYTVFSDTVMIDGQPYYKSDREDYVREDTLTGKLYRYKTLSHSEVLVCDMSLSQGDTFNFAISNEFIYHINKLKVDTVFYDMDGRKRIYFNLYGSTIINNNFSYLRTEEFQIPMAFIEGIGPIYGPLGEYGWGIDILLCVEKDDSLAFVTNEMLGCYQTYNWWWNINVEENTALQLQVYPNPASQRVLVEVEGWNGAGTLRLINSVGMVLQTVKMEDAVTELNISKYANGLYTILYTDDKNNRTAVKFVKQE